MRKPPKRLGRQNAKRAKWITTRKSTTTSMSGTSWDKGIVDQPVQRKPRFPKGFKKGDFVSIAPSKDRELEELRQQTHVYMIIETCWVENVMTGEEEEGFRLRAYDPTGIVCRESVDYDDSDVAFSGVAIVDVSTLGIAAQKLNDFIQRIVKDGK